MRQRKLLSVGLGLVAWGHMLLAQTANVSGRVIDRSQLALPGAIVEITALATSQKRSMSTNDSGVYSLPDLTPGRYDVTVSAKGFSSQEQRGFVLEVGQQAQLDFKLEVGRASEALNVNGGPDRLQTSDAAVSTIVERTLTDNLPLNGRSFQNLITLAPGVTLANAQNGSGQFVVNGMRATFNSFSIDGVNAVSTVTGYQSAGGNNAGYNLAGGTNGMASVDAVDEFRILTSSFAPEYGRNPGAHVLVATRSGTNQVHGSVFDYFRNDKLDAADWFVNQAGQNKPRLRANDFGGVLGGPIARDKMFFFVSYEGQRLTQPQFAITSVPSAAARSAAPAVAQPFLDAFPLPNGPDLGNNHAQFAAGYSNPLQTDSILLRMDRTFDDRLRGFATFTYAPSAKSSRSNSSSASLADTNVQTLRTRSLTAGLTYVVNTALVSDVRINFADSVNASHFTMDTFGGAIVPQNDLLLPGTTPLNYYSFVNLGHPGGDLFGGTVGTQIERQINLVDGTNYVHGGHQMKFGVDWRLLLPLVTAAGHQYFQFDDVTGFLNNQLDAFHNTAPARARTEITNVSLYAQDLWRISASLSLTYGMRWEFTTVPHSLDSNNGNLVPLTGDYATSQVTVGAPGTPLWKQQHLNFAPRVGAAWQVSRGTVLRAGGGLFYDAGIAEAASQPWVSGYPSAQATVLLSSRLPVSPSLAVLPPVNLSQPPPGNLFFQFPANVKAPRVWEWNMAIEQALGKDRTLTVTYVGSAGRRLLYASSYPEVTSNIYTVTYTDDSGSSSYHALESQFEQRFSHGLAATAGYTWGHSIDTNSSDTAVYVPGVYEPPASNRGDSDFDIRQAFHGGVSWNLPGRWGLDGILTSQTALPINATFHHDIGFGSYDFRPNLVAGMPVWIENQNVAGGRELNPAALIVPSTPMQGNLGRNALRGFDLVQMDLSVRRSFPFGDKMRVLFRADLFNALNHPDFANPVSFIGSGLFGIATSTVANSQVGGGAFGLNSVFNAGGPRAVQLSMKLQF